MKYKSISLHANNKNNNHYNLIKYNDKYRKELSELKKMDKFLADAVKKIS